MDLLLCQLEQSLQEQGGGNTGSFDRSCTCALERQSEGPPGVGFLIAPIFLALDGRRERTLINKLLFFGREGSRVGGGGPGVRGAERVGVCLEEALRDVGKRRRETMERRRSLSLVFCPACLKDAQGRREGMKGSGEGVPAWASFLRRFLRPPVYSRNGYICTLFLLPVQSPISHLVSCPVL